MTIDEIEIQIKDNATKAKAILTDENGVVADAQALLNKNDELKAKIIAIKSIDEQLLPVRHRDFEGHFFKVQHQAQKGQAQPHAQTAK